MVLTCVRGGAEGKRRCSRCSLLGQYRFGYCLSSVFIRGVFHFKVFLDASGAGVELHATVPSQEPPAPEQSGGLSITAPAAEPRLRAGRPAGRGT